MAVFSTCKWMLGLSLFFSSLHAAQYCAFFNETKHNEYNFLSNFHPCKITTSFGTFQCSEAFYQYSKFAYLDNAKLKEAFLHANGQQAFDLSRKHASLIDPNWDKEAVMKQVLLAKFSDPELQEKLLSTKNAYLVENSPKGHDSFWADNGDGGGENKLGIMLMQIRKELGGESVSTIPSILEKFYQTKCSLCENPCHFTNKEIIYNLCDAHIGRELKLGNVSKMIRLSNIPDGTGRFLYFNLNDMPEFVEEGARLIAERIKELNLENPFFVTPEASTISLAHVLRTKYGIDGVILSKRKKPDDVDVYLEEYCAVTSLESKTLYLEKSTDLQGKDIVIIDNVCTTGETLRAVHKLLTQAGVASKNIKEAIVLYTEGDDMSFITTSNELKLKVHRFEHLPLFPKDPTLDNVLYRLYSSSRIPTSYGPIDFYVFRHRSLDLEAIACVSPLTFLDKRRANIPVRIHDACITSETFHSLKCDCQLQLQKAMEYITEYGGIVIYLQQEGRGIGLANKIAAYNLQETQHLDTVAANRALGLPDDAREYHAAKDILEHFKIESVLLISNNLHKVHCLESLGVKVGGRIPCIVKPESLQMQKYMKDKAEQMGHIIPSDKLNLK